MYFLIVLGVFLLMEGIAWVSHKYVMHGFLWKWHEDHHKPGKSFFEKNDRFYLIFAVPSFVALLYGCVYANPVWISVGVGASLYGMAYFFVHDVFIHQRFGWFKNSDNVYLKGIRRAHKIHHKHLYKEDGECFGMLLVPFKYFSEARKQPKGSPVK